MAAPRLATPSDAAKAALLLVEAAVAALLPERRWAGAARGVARLMTRAAPARSVALARSMPARHRGPASPPAAAAAPLELVATLIEEDVQLLRCWLPGGWHPAIELRGEERLVEALSHDRGAILWVTSFAASSLVVNMALHRAGYGVTHLGRPSHGFSETRLGMRLLNPLRTRVEDRYLRERVVLERDGAVRAMRHLRARLRENGTVSITVADLARQTMHVPFLGGQLPLPTGPLSLARSSGAPLLPVHSVRNEAGAFEVHIAQPLAVGGRADGDAALARSLDQYVHSLAPFVERYPGQWLGWRSGWTPPSTG